ncbi:MAG: hypothetical protein H7Y37_19685 [Anaerolineae bacterium]|nr:hypothetical protein [Gloeobacterales cyanobacterium ES-bin-313]
MSLPLAKFQIACLRLDDQEKLLVEVQDLVIGKSGEMTCWARPLVLCTGEMVQDVRQTPDLLWPAQELEVAYDSDVLPAMDLLATEVLFPEPERTAILWRFLERLRKLHHSARFSA